MTLEITTALIAFAFVSSITPGPNNLMLMTSGINFGLVKTIPHMLGIDIGFTIMVFLVGLGLAQVFETFPMIYTALKVISVGYLTYLAWKIATSDPLSNNYKRAEPMTFMQAALFQWVNPKAWIMAITAISTYTSSSSQSLYSIVLVAGIFGLVLIPSTGTWVFLGSQLQRFLNNPLKLKIFNIMAALLLISSLIPVIF